jgi:hypothetical protein
MLTKERADINRYIVRSLRRVNFGLEIEDVAFGADDSELEFCNRTQWNPSCRIFKT